VWAIRLADAANRAEWLKTMLKSIAIRNYRSCLKTSLEFHPKLSVLIGPNGSGKTNILQGVMLLKKLSMDDARFRRPQDSVSGSSGIRAVFQQESVRCTLRASIYTHADDSNNDVVEASYQRWRFSAANGRSASLDFPLSLPMNYMWHDRAYAGRIMSRHLNARQLYLWPPGKGAKGREWALDELAKTGRFCAGLRYYGASQFTNPSSCPVSFEIEGDRKALGPIQLSGHARLLYDMYSASKAAHPDKYQQFLEIVGPAGLGLISGLSFREIPTSSVDHAVTVGGKIEKRPKRKILVVPQFRIGRQRLSPNQLSEGTFKTLALLFNVIISDSTAVLIEEPEVCVHHGLLASILELIKSRSEHKQIILSTHSDYVLDRVSPENVFRVTFDRTRGTEIKYIPKSMTAKELNALRRYLESEGNLGEFWREGGLGDRP
jgi:ABC-type lipoprotein export system ATPase subunit